MKRKDIHLLVIGGVTLACLEILWNLPLGRVPMYWVPTYQPLLALLLNFFLHVLFTVVPVVVLGCLISLATGRRFQPRWFLIVFAAFYFFYMGATVWWRLFGLAEYAATPLGEEIEPGSWLTLTWLAMVIVLTAGWVFFTVQIGRRGLNRAWLTVLSLSALVGCVSVGLRWPQGPFHLLFVGMGVIFIFHFLVWFLTRRLQINSYTIFVVVLCLALLATVFRGIWASSGGEATRPNLVVLVWDTARADHMSVYGYHDETTPSAERLSRSGVVFTSARAPSNFTFPSHVGMFTGLYNREHGLGYGVVDDLKEFDRLETVAEVLRRKGYLTLMITENIWVAPLYRGFSHYFWLDPGEVRPSLKYASGETEATPLAPAPFFRNLPSSFLLRQLMDHIEYSLEGFYKYFFDQYILRLIQERLLLRKRSQPLFCFINIMNAHGRYHPYRSYRLEETISPYNWPEEYDLALRECDRRLANLLATFRQAGEMDDTVFILTSDHGELLGEYDLYMHQKTMFDPVLRIPLIIYSSHWVKGRKVDTPVTLVSLKGALEMLASGGLPTTETKEHLVSHFLNNRGVVAEHRSPGPEEVFKSYTYVDKKGAKLIYDEQCSALGTPWGKARHFMFDLNKDPEEMNNLFESRAEDRERLLQEYQQWRDKTPQARMSEVSGEYHPALKKRLKAMGYI